MADNSLVYEILYGHKPDSKEPAEFKVFRKMATKLMDMGDHGKPIVREVATIGIKNDLGDYLPYLFFAFHASGSSRNWPLMPPHMVSALNMGRWVLTTSLAVPNYSREIVTPPPEFERNVDHALVDLAVWCGTDLHDDLMIRYLRILKENLLAFGHASDNPEAGSSVKFLRKAFEERVTRNPAAFPGGDNLSRLFRFIGLT